MGDEGGGQRQGVSCSAWRSPLMTPQNDHVRILLVEDSPADAKLIGHALRLLPGRVDVERVQNASAMRHALAVGRWDVVLSDWSMPSFSALGALAVLQESSLDLPFIIVSGTIGEEPAVEAMRAGAHDYVLKGNLTRLVPAIEREVRESLMRASRAAVAEALRAAEARFRGLWNSAVLLVAISDADGRISDVNEAGARLLGYTRDELVNAGITWESLTPQEWAAADRVAGEQLRRTGATMAWEKELIRKDGGHVAVLAALARAATNEAVAIGIDRTEQKHAEAALETRARIAGLTADVAIALADQEPLDETLRRCVEGIVQRLDAAFARVWLIGDDKAVLKLHASAGLSSRLDGRYACIRVGECKVGRIAQSRLPHLHNDIQNDGELAEPDWAAREGLTAFAGRPLLVGGELVGVLALFSRATIDPVVVEGLAAVADTLAVGIQRKRVERVNESLEAQLRQAQKMEAVGRLAAGVAHDFNNLLSVILGYGQLLLHDLSPADPMREDLEQINSAAVRATALTRQLLMFSRRQVVEPRNVNLNDLLASIEPILRRMIGEDMDLVVITAARLPLVYVDPGSIEQLVMNLIVNARDAMPTGGKVTIETRDVVLDELYARANVGVVPGPHVLLRVTDTGTGMDEATRERIFEPFFTTKPLGKGTGLGLATVFGIVQQSGANVRVETAPGAGTTFFVYFPPAAGEVAPGRPSVRPAVLGGAETILLVEDDSQVRMAAASILRRQGYQVLESADGDAALRVSAEHGGVVDLLLSDVVMPRMSGPELATRLTALRPRMKVVFMSGYTDDVTLHHGVRSAEVAFLQKPLTPESLALKIREVLDLPFAPHGLGTA